MKTSATLTVGDIVKVNQNERFPADCLLLYTTEKTGSVFIRTDQLDGETDWKLRKAVAATQSAASPAQALRQQLLSQISLIGNDRYRWLLLLLLVLRAHYTRGCNR